MSSPQRYQPRNPAAGGIQIHWIIDDDSNSKCSLCIRQAVSTLVMDDCRYKQLQVWTLCSHHLQQLIKLLQQVKESRTEWLK